MTPSRRYFDSLVRRTGTGNYDVVKEVFRILRSLSKPPSKIYIRGDTALYEHKVLRLIDGEGGEFAISADMTPQLRAAIEADRSPWNVLNNRDGSPGEFAVRRVGCGRKWCTCRTSRARRRA